MNTQHIEVSVIMPAYNLEHTITHAIKLTQQILQQITSSYEIIIVDDGSRDNTYQKALKATNNPQVKVIRNRKNMGKGFAIKKGVLHASSKKYIIILDADLEIPPEQIKYHLHALKKYDITIASKRHPKSCYQAPLIRKLLSAAFNLLARLLAKVPVADTQTGLKAFKAEALKKILMVALVKKYAFDAELLTIANELGYQIVEIPVTIRQYKAFSIRSILRMFIDLLAISYRLRIAKWYQAQLVKLTKMS